MCGMAVDREEIVKTTWLSDRESEVFEKYYNQEKGPTQVAEELEIKVNTVKTNIQRIKEKLEKSKNTVELFEEDDNRG